VVLRSRGTTVLTRPGISLAAKADPTPPPAQGAVTLRALEQGAWKTSDVFPQLERALGMPPGRLAKQYRTWLRRRPGSAQEGKGKGNGSAAEA